MLTTETSNAFKVVLIQTPGFLQECVSFMTSANTVGLEFEFCFVTKLLKEISHNL